MINLIKGKNKNIALKMFCAVAHLFAVTVEVLFNLQNSASSNMQKFDKISLHTWVFALGSYALVFDIHVGFMHARMLCT